MFGKYFSHVLVLTLLAGTSYSLPQVKDAIGDAFAFGYTGGPAAVIQAIEPDQIVVKNIALKTILGQSSQESSLSITANVELKATNSDLKINSFAFALKNSTAKVNDVYVQSSNIILNQQNDSSSMYVVKQVGNLIKDSNGMYVIKKGTKATFTVTASANPAQMFAGQYYASLLAVYGDDKISAPSNRSSLVSIIGENSPYITLIGSNVYGKKDTVVMNGVRLGTNPTLTLTKVKTVGSDSYTRNIPIRLDGNSNQFKISLTQYNIPIGQYVMYTVNSKLGQTAGKSNQIMINVVDQKKIVTATVTPGKLALAYDSAQKETALSAPFTVVVKAGANDIQINQNSFIIVARNTKGDQMTGQISFTSINKGNPTLPFTIKANQEATFSIVASVNPKRMFAGSYSMSLLSIYQAGVDTAAITIPDNSTNSVVIIGETSPYITSVVPSNAIGGKNFTVNGQRLNNTSIYIDGIILANTTISVSTDGTSLTFTLPTSLRDGQHILSVWNTLNSISNTISFTSIGYVPVVVPIVSPSNVYTVYAPATVYQSGSTTQQFSFTFSLTAGNYPAYISKTQASAVTTYSNLNGIGISLTGITDNDSNGDTTNYFYISPGQTKTFLATYKAIGMASSTGVFGVSSINFGTTTASMNIPLTTDLITNNLKATLFH